MDANGNLYGTTTYGGAILTSASSSRLRRRITHLRGRYPSLAARGASGGFSARLMTEPDTRFHEALGKGRGGPASAKPILVNSTPEE